MLTLTGINAVPYQIFRTPIDEGLIKFTLRYMPSVKMWYIDIEFNSFIAKSIRVCNSWNILDQYSDLIPFGLLVITIDGTEPLYINDFSTGRVEINLLSKAETDAVEERYKELRVL